MKQAFVSGGSHRREALQQTYLHEIKIIEGARLGVGATQSHEDEANERDDGEDIGREDTRDTAGFPHVD